MAFGSDSSTGAFSRKCGSQEGSITLCRIEGSPRGATWGGDGTILFATSDPASGLLTVPDGGGDVKVLTKPDRARGETDHLFPSLLPGGRAVLFTLTVPGQPIENAGIAVLDLKTGERRALIDGGTQPEYVESGHLVYSVAGTLRAARFDLSRLEVTSAPVPVVAQVSTRATGASDFAVSREGTLVYAPGGAQESARRSLVWVDRQGREEPIKAPPRSYIAPRLSPEGTRVALDIRDQESGIWIWDLGRQTATRLTTAEPGQDQFPVWTSDARRIIFSSARGGGEMNLYWQAADGTGTVERLTTSANRQFAPFSGSPDGKRVVFVEVALRTGNDIHLLSLENPRRAAPLLQSPFGEINAEISPDGRWIAYQSDETGQNQIYVRPFPNVDVGRWPISASGGIMPVWARSGRELFYLDGKGALTAVSVQTAGSTFSAGRAVTVFETRYFFQNNVRTYDVSSDGQRFLMIRQNRQAEPSSGATPESLIVALNWTDELKARVPANENGRLKIEDLRFK